MRLLKRRGGLVGVGGAVLVAALLFLVGAAEAAFPGRNGLLAVQPLHGRQTVLIEPNGSGERFVSVAAIGYGFGYMNRPMWSPDGQMLLLDGVGPKGFGRGVGIYTDGIVGFPSEGAGFEGSDAAFTSNSTLFTVNDNGRLLEEGTDALARRMVVSGKVSDAVWSSQGEIAITRTSWIWVGLPGRLHRFTQGSAPSWSPDGSQLVFDRHGWVMIARLGGSSTRRLVRGTAPAWSPNGKWIAFFGLGHRLSIVRITGGSVWHVGAIRGWSVDWQPIQAKPPAACQTPPGSKVIASSQTAVLSLDYVPKSAASGAAWAAMGCFLPDGQELTLKQGNITPLFGARGEVFPTSPGAAAVAGPFSAIVVSWVNDGDGQGAFRQTSVFEFDLRNGTSPIGPFEPGTPEVQLGGESMDCNFQTGASCTIDRLVLGPDAVSAVHITTVNAGCSCTVEQIQVSDNNGARALDSVTEADGSPPSLTNLTLTGDTLSWEHDGTPRSVQLQPYTTLQP